MKRYYQLYRSPFTGQLKKRVVSKVFDNTATLLTPSFGNHLFECNLVLKHPHVYKYDIVILLHSNSRKKCHKNFEIWFINNNLMPKNDLDLVFFMYNAGNPKNLNLEY